MRVVVNAAMSADGKLAARDREQLEISGARDFERVDELRANSDAVMVGIETVLADDPHLTVEAAGKVSDREARGLSAQPVRIVADSTARTPADARICDEAATTIVLCSEAAPPDRVERLEAAGVDVIVAGTTRVDLETGLDAVAATGVSQLMVEGGGELIFGLLEAGLVDELSVFIGPLLIGGREAPTLVDGDGFVGDFPSLSLHSISRLDDGVLVEWTVDRD